MRYPLIATMLVVTAVSLGGCSESASQEVPRGLIVEGEAVSSPYNGPMTVVREGEAGGADTGVAGLALECDGEPYRGGSVDYDVGLAEVQGTPAGAVANLLDRTVLGSVEMPTQGYRREREEIDRVLLSYDVAGRTKVAIVVAAGIEDYLDHEGWGVEWYAQCDPAELPAAVTKELGVGVWENESGDRVPVTEIRSFQGEEHCNAEDVTFLQADFAEPPALFVRDTENRYAELLTTTFRMLDGLPQDAVDTRYERNRRSLWLSPAHDAAYLVSDADATDVELWPAAIPPFACA
jgi:hypothetical protein